MFRILPPSRLFPYCPEKVLEVNGRYLKLLPPIIHQSILYKFIAAPTDKYQCIVGILLTDMNQVHFHNLELLHKNFEDKIDL